MNQLKRKKTQALVGTHNIRYYMLWGEGNSRKISLINSDLEIKQIIKISGAKTDIVRTSFSKSSC